MPRKEKQYFKNNEDFDDMIGGSIATQYIRDNRKKYGGAICTICKHHIDLIDSESDSDSDSDDMLGGGYLSNFASKVEKVSRTGAAKTKQASKNVGKYVTSKQENYGLASDLLNYAVPAASSAALGAAATAASGGNPVVGIAASALGSKLGKMAGEEAADRLLKEGGGYAMGTHEAREHAKFMREKKHMKHRFVKGSKAAKEHMAKVRAARNK